MQRDQASMPVIVSLSSRTSPQRGISHEQATPHWILQWFDGVWLFGYLKAAIELEIFALIAAGMSTVAEIAAAISASERGIRVLLDALAALGLLQKDAAYGYHLQPHTAAYLAKDGPIYHGARLQIDNSLTWPCWSRLSEAVCTGQPVFDAQARHTAPEFWAPLAISLNALLRPAASALMPELTLGANGRLRRVLEIGSGASSFGQVLAVYEPSLLVTLVDRPHVLRVTYGRALRLGLANRFNGVPGEPAQVEWGKDHDVVLLSNVLQQGSPAKNAVLLARAFAALRPGGSVVINELIADAERRTAIHPLLFAGAMLLGHAGGDIYTFREIQSWLHLAQFISPRIVPVPGRINTLIIARKPA